VPSKKERQYNGQIKRRSNTMAKLKGETMQWPNKKERQYNGQIKRRDNTMTK
jgi:ribosomal protein L37E